jgi:hypothetical protein
LHDIARIVLPNEYFTTDSNAHLKKLRTEVEKLKQKEKVNE